MNVTFSHDHGSPTDCQVFIALTGTKELIREHLQDIITEMDGKYGKPQQGTNSGYNAIRSVITPIWNGQSY